MPSEVQRRPGRALVVAAALVIGGTAASAQEQPNGIDASNFRAIGKARTCIDAKDIGNMIPAGDHALLFNITGNVWLRNDVGDNCRLLRQDVMPNWQKGIYLNNRNPDKICGGDRFTVIDNTTIAWIGQCELGRFTPVAVP